MNDQTFAKIIDTADGHQVLLYKSNDVGGNASLVVATHHNGVTGQFELSGFDERDNDAGAARRDEEFTLARPEMIESAVQSVVSATEQ